MAIIRPSDAQIVFQCNLRNSSAERLAIMRQMRGTYGKLAGSTFTESTPDLHPHQIGLMKHHFGDMLNNESNRRFYSFDMECGTELKTQFDRATEQFKTASINAAILQGRLHQLNGWRPMHEPRRTLMSHYVRIALNHWRN